VESLPPPFTAIRDEYIGLGKELTELRLAFLVTQLKQGGPHRRRGSSVRSRRPESACPFHGLLRGRLALWDGDLIAADKEVILAAGAINSPKLLMLSGVGEANALRNLRIGLVENLPGVGENLQDHVLVSGVVFKYKGKMPDRPADSNAVEAEAYLSSGPSGDTDISLVLHQLPVVTPEVASRYGIPPADAFTIAPPLVQPTSKGSLRLANDNFQHAAVIDGNYVGTDHDFAAVMGAIEAAPKSGIRMRSTVCARANSFPGPR
jgi:choline dehydrogenase